jgi:hypothetical protein
MRTRLFIPISILSLFSTIMSLKPPRNSVDSVARNTIRNLGKAPFTSKTLNTEEDPQENSLMQNKSSQM